MKKVVTICAVAALLAFVGTVETAKADHCSSGRFSSFSFGRPSYYAQPTYSSNYYQSSGFGGFGGYGYSQPNVIYSRPGFSISFGSGSGFRSSSFGHSHNHNHNHNHGGGIFGGSSRGGSSHRH